ncbi:MAG TPA: hypothetical protein IAA02_03785 [Candidatus Sutterella merdavium]|nr:hypothetical protein [Candidatus Sutterella merdavium]
MPGTNEKTKGIFRERPRVLGERPENHPFDIEERLEKGRVHENVMKNGRTFSRGLPAGRLFENIPSFSFPRREIRKAFLLLPADDAAFFAARSPSSKCHEVVTGLSNPFEIMATTQKRTFGRGRCVTFSDATSLGEPSCR